MKEMRGVLILTLKELNTSLVPNWFLLWGLFYCIGFCMTDRFLSNCGCYLLYHIIRAS